MTKPRQSTSRELFGILGSHPKKSEILKKWNLFFKEKGIDAFMDSYTVKDKDISTHLSDMFLFDRRAYIVAPVLQKLVLPYLDDLDDSVKDKVTLIINRGGMIEGYFLDELSVQGIWKLINKTMKQ